MKLERDPDRLWLDNNRYYIEIEEGRYVIVHDEENIAGYCGPEVLLQTTILKYGENNDDGIFVRAAAIPWFEILKQIARDPLFMFQFSRKPRKFEEFIAGAYRADGWDEVTLTPSSGDKGRDVIAVKSGFCSVRVLDQAKAYAPGHLVTHGDVREMLGVLSSDQNASKGIITTTSDFAPKIFAGGDFRQFIPYRLQLKNGQELLKWLTAIKTHQIDSTAQQSSVREMFQSH